MSSLRNFGISFVAALLIFSGLAYYIFSSGYLENLFDKQDDMHGSNQNQGVIFDPNAGTNDQTPIKTGRSFNMVVIGTDYDPIVYNDYTSSGLSGKPEVLRKVKASIILFVRFDKKERTIILSNIPAETTVTFDYVEMTLGEAYAFGGATYIKEKVSTLTGMTADFYVEFSGRDFAKYATTTLLTHDFTVPYTTTTDSSKGLSPMTFSKGQIISDADSIYTLLHYDGYSTATVGNRYATVQSFFLQVMKKLALTKNADYFYTTFVSPLNTDIVKEDITELIEVIYTLSLYIDDSSASTTLTTVDFYKYGNYLQDGTFVANTQAIKNIFNEFKD